MAADMQARWDMLYMCVLMGMVFATLVWMWRLGRHASQTEDPKPAGNNDVEAMPMVTYYWYNAMTLVVQHTGIFFYSRDTDVAQFAELHSASTRDLTHLNVRATEMAIANRRFLFDAVLCPHSDGPSDCKPTSYQRLINLVKAKLGDSLGTQPVPKSSPPVEDQAKSRSDGEFFQLELPHLRDLVQHIKTEPVDKDPQACPHLVRLKRNWHGVSFGYMGIQALLVLPTQYRCFSDSQPIPPFLAAGMATQHAVLGFALVLLLLLNREAVLLGSPKAVNAICFLVLFATCVGMSFLGVLAGTDFCEESEKIRVQFLLFESMYFVMCIVGVRMLVGKLVNVFALRVELITATCTKDCEASHGQAASTCRYVEAQDPSADPSINNRAHQCVCTGGPVDAGTSPRSTSQRKPRMVQLSADCRDDLKRQTASFFDRWVIGMVLVMLSLAPTWGRVMYGVGDEADDSVLQVTVEEAHTIGGTALVLIALLLLDMEARWWMGRKYLWSWLVLMVLVAATQLLVIPVALDFGRKSHSGSHALVAWLAVCVLLLSLAASTIVFASVLLDLELLLLLLHGHPHLSDRLTRS